MGIIIKPLVTEKMTAITSIRKSNGIIPKRDDRFSLM